MLIFIFLFFDKIASMPFSSFDIFCFEFQRAWNWFFFFLKKRNFPYQFFLFTLLRNHQILEQVETIILWKNNLRAHRVDFAAFSCTIRNWWEKPCVSHVVKYTARWESDGGKVPILWGKKWVPTSRALPIRWISLHFVMLWEIDGETHLFHILQSVP